MYFSPKWIIQNELSVLLNDAEFKDNLIKTRFELEEIKEIIDKREPEILSSVQTALTDHAALQQTIQAFRKNSRTVRFVISSFP